MIAQFIISLSVQKEEKDEEYEGQFYLFFNWGTLFYFFLKRNSNNPLRLHSNERVTFFYLFIFLINKAPQFVFFF